MLQALSCAYVASLHGAQSWCQEVDGLADGTTTVTVQGFFRHHRIEGIEIMFLDFFAMSLGTIEKANSVAKQIPFSLAEEVSSTAMANKENKIITKRNTTLL